jgi:hypothetical protein
VVRGKCSGLPDGVRGAVTPDARVAQRADGYPLIEKAGPVNDEEQQ